MLALEMFVTKAKPKDLIKLAQEHGALEGRGSRSLINDSTHARPSPGSLRGGSRGRRPPAPRFPAALPQTWWAWRATR